MKIFTLKEGNPYNMGVFLIVGMGIAYMSSIIYPGYGYFDNLWLPLLGLIISSYYMIDLHAQYHAWTIEIRNKSIKHLESWCFRALITFVLCFLIHVYTKNLEKFTWMFLFTPFWFLLTFNPLLNKYRSKFNVYRDFDFFYIAEKDNGSWLDGIFNNSKYGGQILYFLALLGALFTGYMYIQ